MKIIKIEQVLLQLVRVNPRVIVMKRYSIFPEALGLEPHHQVQFNVIPRTLIERRVLNFQLSAHSLGQIGIFKNDFYSISLILCKFIVS